MNTPSDFRSSDETDIDSLLIAYADTELDAAGVLTVESRLAADPLLIARLADIRALQSRLRTGFAQQQAPRELNADIHGRILAHAARTSPSHDRPQRARRWLAAAAIFLTVIGVPIMALVAILLMPFTSLSETLGSQDEIPPIKVSALTAADSAPPTQDLLARGSPLDRTVDVNRMKSQDEEDGPEFVPEVQRQISTYYGQASAPDSGVFGMRSAGGRHSSTHKEQAQAAQAAEDGIVRAQVAPVQGDSEHVASLLPTERATKGGSPARGGLDIPNAADFATTPPPAAPAPPSVPAPLVAAPVAVQALRQPRSIPDSRDGAALNHREEHGEAQLSLEVSGKNQISAGPLAVNGKLSETDERVVAGKAGDLPALANGVLLMPRPPTPPAQTEPEPTPGAYMAIGVGGVVSGETSRSRAMALQKSQQAGRSEAAHAPLVFNEDVLISGIVDPATSIAAVRRANAQRSPTAGEPSPPGSRPKPRADERRQQSQVSVDALKKVDAATGRALDAAGNLRDRGAAGAGGSLSEARKLPAIDASEERPVTHYDEAHFDIHDIAVASLANGSFPGPDLNIPEPGAKSRRLPAITPEASNGSVNVLAEIIQSVVEPAQWGNPGMSITGSDGTLSIQAPPEIHQQVDALITALRRTQTEPPPSTSLGRPSSPGVPSSTTDHVTGSGERINVFPTDQTDPPHVILAVDQAAGRPQDVIFLSHRPDDPVVEGAEYRLWQDDREARGVVTVRVVKTFPNALLCRIIPTSWVAEPVHIDVQDRAERLTRPGLARLIGNVTAPDAGDAAGALAEHVTLRTRNDLASILRQVGGDRIGLNATQPVVPHLEAPTTVSVQNATRAQALLHLVRKAGLQAQLSGAALTIDSPQCALDPTDLHGLDREQFRAAFGTVPMMSTREDARSTFAIDADTASYDLTRQQVRAGLPIDPLTIRPEQFINAMPMEYPPAQGPEAFTLYAEAAPSPFAAAGAPVWSSTDQDHGPRVRGGEHTALVAIGAVARPAAAHERRPLHLTLAVDCSGSMAQDGGLSRIQIGLTELISHLRADDRLALVAFGDQGHVVLTATSGSEQERLLAAVRGLTTGGATNCTEGLSLAYQLAAESVDPSAESHVVLCTDGGTLAGDGAQAVVARISAFRQRGISLLILGCGGTAYQAGPLQELANAGGGQHVFLDSDAAARTAFAGRLLPQRLSVLAKDAKVQVTWNPQRVSHFRLIGYEERRLAHQDFRNDTVVAGQLSQDSQVTALYEVLLVDGASGPLGTAAVRYFDTHVQQVRELSCPMAGNVLASQASQRLRLLACAAEFAEYLQRGWWSNVHASTADRILTELKRCPLPTARELESLVSRAHTLEQRQGTP